jgi:membrane-associated phospholipid phosphatase
MLRQRLFSVLVFLLYFVTASEAQILDSVPANAFYLTDLQTDPALQKHDAPNISLKAFIVPTALIAYGVVTFKYDQLQTVDYRVKEEVYTEHTHKRLPIDDYLQYAPAAMVYGLNLAGIKGRHNFRDRTIIYLVSDIILNVAVSSGKSLTHKLRPDGSNYLSFPSGHTAHAFASAEFLRQEYKDVSPWYGYAGYAMAVGTGYLRMYNNRHWLSDVAAGAGIGIASTRIAYWLYPKIQRVVFPKTGQKNILLPTYSDGSVGLNFVHRF